jgi:hypothetical protein
MGLRQQRRTLKLIARVLAHKISTVGRSLKAMVVGHLKHLQPPVPMQLYRWGLGLP